MKKSILYSAVALALTIPLTKSQLNAASSLSPVDSASAVKQVLNFDVNPISTINRLNEMAVNGVVGLSAQQLQATEEFKNNNPAAQLRINQMTGTIDSIIGISIAAQGTTPEEAARSFLNQNSAIFEGIGNAQLELNNFRSKPALGGQLVRFDQVINGIKVAGNGLGLVIDSNNRVRSVMGPYQKNLSFNPSPQITSANAILKASQDLVGFQKILPAQALSVLQPAYNKIADQLGIFKTPNPELRIVQTQSGNSLAWQFYYYSTNPFGVFKYLIDANSGEILYREDQVRRAEESQPTDQFADYFPTFPSITSALQNECAIVGDNGAEVGKPAGMLSIKLRKFDESNRVTGLEGTLTGKHAHIENALPTKLPFAQAALGTYSFDEDSQPVKGRPNERDHLAEPSQHLDGISQFIYITNLMEYLDYLHKEGDVIHSRGMGMGDFPDEYPNESVPLVGVVHIPNVLDAPTDPSDPDFVAKLMGLDNAFAVPLSQEINGEEVVVNPTFYGHGYLFNDLAVDFSVPMHEGTHATITPIAGFEGSPEGGALNEGQADLWAYTIGETPDLGTYPVNSCDLRDYLAANNVDPDSFEYIRSGQSQIRYSQLGTRDNTFEVHRDGEIYAGAMWDLRELMLQMYPAQSFNRPDPVSGEANKAISLGKETWERVFLGSMYVLGVSAPDTFVKARDAALVADAILYPQNSMDINSLGRHHALIERVFAAREIGINAEAPLGGVQLISTAVSAFTADQTGAATPQNVVADIVNQDAINISWDSVPNALGYQILKRQGGSPARLFAGVPGRAYMDGDLNFNGYTHVEFVTGNANTNYLDKGQGLGRGAGQGVEALNYQYVIRAIATNTNGQVGFSKLSGTAKTALSNSNVTQKIDTRISNVSFTAGQFSFDQTLSSTTTTDIYSPINFEIIKISSANVTLANADNSGTGQPGSPALFVYNESLDPGQTTSPRHLSFNNPYAELFTIKARVTAQIEGVPSAANGVQDPMDTSPAADREVVYHAVSEHSGMVLIGSTEQTFVDGVDYVDVLFTALDSAASAVATLTADPEVGGAYPDLDFLMLDSAGNVLSSSGNLGPSEQVGSTVVPGETYTLRVNGYANGPTQFNILLDQMVSDPADATTNDDNASNIVEALDEQMIELIVNPLTGTIKTKLL